MKIGLDYHGVIDKNPKFFVSLALALKDLGFEIYILTGESDSLQFETLLKSYNNGLQWWNEIFSVTDYLINIGEHYKIDQNGRCCFNELLWNKCKSVYCKNNNIDLHIDNKKEYLKYFNDSYGVNTKGILF